MFKFEDIQTIFNWISGKDVSSMPVEDQLVIAMAMTQFAKSLYPIYEREMKEQKAKEEMDNDVDNFLKRIFKPKDKDKE